jgi:putative hemolysin
MDPDLIIIFCTLLLSAFTSGVEIAFVSSSRLRIELDINKGAITGKILRFLYNKEGHFIATLLLGNNIALVLFGMSAAKLLDPIITQSWGIHGEALALLTQTVISTLLVLTVAEFLPKAIFQLNPNGLMKSFAVPSYLFYWILYIPTSFIMFISMRFLKLMKVEITNSEKVFSKIDLEHYVQDMNERIKEEEDLGNEIQILQNALDFSKIKARDCMVPRPELIAIEVDEDLEALTKLFIETSISKILVYRDSIDNIIGYIHSFELFKNPTTIAKIMRPIPFVPESSPAKELLEMFTSNSVSIAIVVDEYGGTSGVVTIEDIIEQIFGDIEDEHDTEDWLEEKISDSEYRFSARAEIDYLNENYKLGLVESEEYETLGGLIIHELESIPEAGQEIKTENLRLVIEEVSDRRIEIVRLFLEE